jgi:hypothetical protein
MDPMRIVIDDHNLVPALESVRNEENVWCVIGQVPKKDNPLGNKYKLVDKGVEWDEFLDCLDDSKVLFCLVRQTVKEVPRFAFITWCGEGVPGQIKGKYGYHCKDMEQWIGHFHIQVNARAESDVEYSYIIKEMTKALGAAYESGQIEQGSGTGTKVHGSGYKKDTMYQNLQEQSQEYWSAQPASAASSAPREKKTVDDYKNIQGAGSLKNRFEDLAKPEPAPEIQRTGKRPDFSYKEPEPTPTNVFAQSSQPRAYQQQQQAAPAAAAAAPAAYQAPPPAAEPARVYAQYESAEEEPEPAYEEEEPAYEEPAVAAYEEPAYEQPAEEAYAEEAYEEEGYAEEAYEDEGYAEEGYAEEAAGGGLYCTALYDYPGENDGDLAFAEGDVITVLDQSDASGWWQGELNGVQGFFPSNFVELNQ